MTSKEIFSLVEIDTGLDLRKKTRAREYVEARAVANALSKKHTRESFSKIGANTSSNHATVMHSIKSYYEVYQVYSPSSEDLFIKLDAYLQSKQRKDIEHIKRRMFVHEIINLRGENAILRYRLEKRKHEPNCV